MRVVHVFILLLSLAVQISAQPFFLDSDNRWAQQTLASMTLREKIGQLFVVAAVSCFEQPTEFLAVKLQECPYQMDPDHILNMIENYHVGGVIFIFKSDPRTQIQFTERYQHCAKIPLLIVQDCEWGLAMRLDKDPGKVVQYPRNKQLAEVADEQLIYQLGKEIGMQCAVLGIHMNLAPVADVHNNPQNQVIGSRSFGDDAQKVARLASLYARGLHDAGVLACAKHFPGHGDTDVDSHFALPVIAHDRTRLDAVELVPFKQLTAENIPAIMTAHIWVPALEKSARCSATMARSVVTDLLKTELQFQGLVITDGLGMRAVADQYAPGELELAAFLAGNDILLCPLDVPKAVELIEREIISGRVSEAELDARVLKILRAKSWAFEQHKRYAAIEDPCAFLVRPEAVALRNALFNDGMWV